MEVDELISLTSYTFKKGWLYKNCPHPYTLQLSFYKFAKAIINILPNWSWLKVKSSAELMRTFGVQSQPYENYVFHLFLPFADFAQPIKLRKSLVQSVFF